MEDRPVFMLLLRLTGNEGFDEEAGSGLSLKVSRNTLKAQSINVIRSRPFLLCEMLRPFICTPNIYTVVPRFCALGPSPTLRFHKIILNGRGHVFCVCFDFSRPFFSLRLFHNPAVHNHNPKILVWLQPICLLKV